MIDSVSNDVSRPDSRKGQYDVRLNGKFDFEVKTASLDTNSSFQFNGIRYDTNYTHLFLLGVSPAEIRFFVLSKQELYNYPMVSMAKGSNSAFKLTLPFNRLYSFDEFQNRINEIIQ